MTKNELIDAAYQAGWLKTALRAERNDLIADIGSPAYISDRDLFLGSLRNFTLEKILIPASEAAQLLSMGRSTFWRHVANGSVPGPVKVGGLTRWRVADLRQFAQLASQTTSA
jgi:predicted DNA-binding transcriptional regulator AlpA